MKVLIIGLDGFTWNVLPHVDMPRLEALMQDSMHGILASTVPPVTIPAWVSFSTGCNPGKHGVYGFLRPERVMHRTPAHEGSFHYLVPDYDAMLPVSSRDIEVRTLPEIVSMAGKKGIWINLPCSTPAKVDDVHLGSFMSFTHDTFHPPDLSGDYSYYRLAPSIPMEKSVEYYEDILDVMARRFDAAKSLLDEDWDCFFVLFSGTDWVQHACYDRIMDGTAEDEAYEVYRRADDYIGYLIDNAPDDTAVMLMSDHGFRTYEYGFSINDWLAGRGYLKMTKGERHYTEHAKRLDEGDMRRSIDVSALSGLAKRVPGLNQAMVASYMALKKVLPIKRYMKVSGYQRKPVAAESKAISPTNDCFGIYLIERGDVYKDRQRLMDMLNAERSPFTGESPFDGVYPSENIYTYVGNSISGDAPDLICMLKDHAVSMSSPTGEAYYKLRRNYHDYDGIYLISYNGVKAGRADKRSIMDLAPTVLAMMGIPVPDDMDGETIYEGTA